MRKITNGNLLNQKIDLGTVFGKSFSKGHISKFITWTVGAFAFINSFFFPLVSLIIGAGLIGFFIYQWDMTRWVEDKTGAKKKVLNTVRKLQSLIFSLAVIGTALTVEIYHKLLYSLTNNQLDYSPFMLLIPVAILLFAMGLILYSNRIMEGKLDKYEQAQIGWNSGTFMIFALFLGFGGDVFVSLLSWIIISIIFIKSHITKKKITDNKLAHISESVNDSIWAPFLVYDDSTISALSRSLFTACAWTLGINISFIELELWKVPLQALFLSLLFLCLILIYLSLTKRVDTLRHDEANGTVCPHCHTNLSTLVVEEKAPADEKMSRLFAYLAFLTFGAMITLGFFDVMSQPWIYRINSISEAATGSFSGRDQILSILGRFSALFYVSMFSLYIGVRTRKRKNLEDVIMDTYEELSKDELWISFGFLLTLLILVLGFYNTLCMANPETFNIYPLSIFIFFTLPTFLYLIFIVRISMKVKSFKTNIISLREQCLICGRPRAQDWPIRTFGSPEYRKRHHKNYFKLVLGIYLLLIIIGLSFYSFITPINHFDDYEFTIEDEGVVNILGPFHTTSWISINLTKTEETQLVVQLATIYTLAQELPYTFFNDSHYLYKWTELQEDDYYILLRSNETSKDIDISISIFGGRKTNPPTFLIAQAVTIPIFFIQPSRLLFDRQIGKMRDYLKRQ